MKKRYIIIIPVLCLVLMTIIFRMIFFIGYVPSSSMEPTLKAGSVILGLRWHGELKNGDIIISGKAYWIMTRHTLQKKNLQILAIKIFHNL